MNQEDILQMQIFEFIRKIFTLSHEFAFSISSWKRTEKRNRLVGGKPTSKHLIWLAVDIVLDSLELKDFFFKRVKELGLKYLDEGDHIHVQV